MGYDPVLNERGHIPYGNKERLEEYCYKEIQMCDVLISIIGGRYGSSSTHEDDTISQHELKTALELGKQVFVFIDKSVKSEHRWYCANKGNSDVRYTSVDNKNVFEIIDFIESLPLNNATFGFDTGQEIVYFLKEQLGGLFKNLMVESSKDKEVILFRDLKENVDTLKKLVAALSSDQSHRQEKVSEVLVLHHPAFQRIRGVMKIKHRVVFLNMADLESLLNAYGFKILAEFEWDDPAVIEYSKSLIDKTIEYIKINRCIFDADEALKVYDPVEWDDKWIVKTLFIPESKNISRDDEPAF